MDRAEHQDCLCSYEAAAIGLLECVGMWDAATAADAASWTEPPAKFSSTMVLSEIMLWKLSSDSSLCRPAFGDGGAFLGESDFFLIDLLTGFL